MSQKIEIQVIDDKLLMEGILDDKLVAEADLSRLSGEFNLVELAPNVNRLTLSFKNIGRIENLIGFDHLIKLCLDNNHIEEISNLGHLTTLKWLDLSFNKIRKIQGLENLSQLEDLSLYSNKIAAVDGLEKCTSLQCLSVGNNRIDSLEQVVKLRQLRSLRMLTLSGNPICKEPEYRMNVLAYVDCIKYLDYALIDPNERSIAKEQYHDELIDLDEKETVIAEKSARDRAMESYIKKLEDACILFAHTLFDDLFADDIDVERLRHMPNVKDHIEQFRNSFVKLADDYIKTSMEKFEKKKKEINEFEKVIKNVRIRDELDSTQLIEGFNNSKRVISDQITAANSTLSEIECQQLVKSLQDELDKVCDELMNIEVRQVEKFEALIDDFDNRLNDLKADALEGQQQFFRHVEEFEEKFSSGVRAVATDLIDRLAREEITDDYLDDEAMSLVVDKDACMTVLSSSHDMHIGRILKREDEARGAEIRRFQGEIAKHLNEESARNRDRVLQIHHFSKMSKSSLHALLSLEDEEGFDDDDLHLLNYDSHQLHITDGEVNKFDTFQFLFSSKDLASSNEEAELFYSQGYLILSEAVEISKIIECRKYIDKHYHIWYKQNKRQDDWRCHFQWKARNGLNNQLETMVSEPEFEKATSTSTAKMKTSIENALSENLPLLEMVFHSPKIMNRLDYLIGKVSGIFYTQIAFRTPVMQGPGVLSKSESEMYLPGAEYHLDGQANGKGDRFPDHWTIMIGVALVDILTEDMGNFTIFPGSHTSRSWMNYPQEKKTKTLPSLGKSLKILLRQGDAIFVHVLLAHRGGKNVMPQFNDVQDSTVKNIPANTREMVFFRLQASNIDYCSSDRATSVIRNPWHEYRPFFHFLQAKESQIS